MPVDFNAPEGARTPENEANLFALTPIWAREGKTRGGRRVTPRPQADPAIDAGEAGAGAGVMGATTATEPADAAYETQSVGARAGRGVSAAAILAGLAAAAILAGIGWHASQQHRGGLAVLTPGGAPPATQTALATPRAPTSTSELPLTRVSDPPAPASAAASDTAATEPSAPGKPHSQAAPNAADEAANASAETPRPATAPTSAGAGWQSEPTNLNPLAGTTSPVPPASTPSASSADPGSSPAATPRP